jgi:sensor histidine kinase YesM
MLDDSLKKEDTRQLIQRGEFEQRILADSLARAEENARVQLAFEQQMRRKGVTTTWILAGGSIVLLLALMFLGGMVFFQRNAQRLGARTRELEKQQLVNEISLLRTQVNPHFLFNSLSILSSLVRVDTDLSEKFIDQLSKSYRYILEQSEQATVTLRTELGFIESYAYLLRIRFENKFDLDIRIPEEYLDTYRIAPLTLQLLIENAVKHNRMSVQEPLRIRIRVDADNTLVVSNTLQRRPMAAGSTGVGLRNIRSRYALLTRQPFWAGEADGAFVVRIPLLPDTGAAS